MKLSSAVQPISQVKAHMSEIVADMTRTHNKVVITHNGEAKAVLQDIESYEQMQESLAMLKLIAMSTNSMTKGNGTSVAAAFAEVRKRVRR